MEVLLYAWGGAALFVISEKIENEYPQVAGKLCAIFKEMEIHKRKYERNYNEALVEKGETIAVYFYGQINDKPYQVEDIPEFLRRYAQNNDLPIICFGT